MVKKPPIKKVVQKALVISPAYTHKLLEIANYGYELFGAKVSDNFIAKVENRVMALPQMPDIHPKSRFIKSSEKKVYRNILVEKYAILYSVTYNTIKVITIYYTAINPKTIEKFK
jgi:plasmid stabilization system protein ParE